MNVIAKWKLARLNARIARLEAEEAVVKRQLDYLRFTVLPKLREERNRMIFPHVSLY